MLLTPILFPPDSRSGFAWGNYAAFRPTYPPSLYRTILGYHGYHKAPRGGAAAPSPAGTLLDLGCGHGVISRTLAPSFESVVATDPSAGSVAQATKQLPPGTHNITVRQASAEDLACVEDASVDMVVAGQAAHWFDPGRTWPELARVVRPGGTLAFFGYKDSVLVGYPQTMPIFERFTYGTGEVAPGTEGMGRFWEPGRFILRDSLRAVQPPASDWAEEERIVWDPDRRTCSLEGAPEEAVWMRKTMRLGDVEAYWRTFSAMSNWQEAHPERKARAEGGEGDVVDVMFDEVVGSVPEWKARGEAWRDVDVESVWGTVIIMARRRQ